MSRLAGDEIYQILSFCCNDSNAIIYEYSLINWQWREECMKLPLHIKKDQPISKAMDRFRIVKLKLGYSYQDKLPLLELKHLTKLTTPNLELSNESIMKCQFWKNLKTLKITDFSLSYEQVLLLCACKDFTNLEHLTFRFTAKHSNKSTFEIFNHSHFTNVKTAILQSGMTRVKITRKLENLESLTLRGFITRINLGDKNFLPNLKELDISQNIDLVDLSFLKSIPQLTYLNMNCNDSNVKFKDNLSNLQNLKHLSMSACCYRDQKLILGELQLRNIEFLNISHNALKLTKFFNDGKSCVSNITHLEVRNHAYYFNDDDCQLIGSGIVLQNLTFLSLSNSFGINNFEAIINGPNMENLKTLELHSSCISIENIKSLTKSPTLTQLTNLDISNNSIKDEGCKILCQAPNLKLLQELEISENDLSGKCGKFFILKCFPNLTELKMLTKSINIFDD